MLTSIRHKRTKKKGSHKYDKFFHMSISKKKWRDKSITRTAYFQLADTFVLDELRMSRDRLSLLNLKKFNHSYVRSKCSKTELEQLILDHLDEVRMDIGLMLKMKGNDPDFGYSNLRLGDRVIAANLCYEESFANGAYYYGDPEDNMHPFFIMGSSDHWVEEIEYVYTDDPDYEHTWSDLP
eukprot:7960_1